MGKHWAPIGPGLAANLRNFCSDIQVVKLNFMISKLELVEFKLIQETRSLPRPFITALLMHGGQPRGN